MSAALHRATLEIERNGWIKNNFSVPYAMPPTGDGRFKPPSQIPYVQWFDLHIVWNATQFIHTCFQPKMSEDDLDYLESESCLFVNIFTPGMMKEN